MVYCTHVVNNNMKTSFRLTEFKPEGIPIYFHFLNRELLRSLNVTFKDIPLKDILRILLISTTEQFLSSIAFIWESSRYLGNAVRILEGLYRGKHLTPISQFATVDEFMSFCQTVYSYDSKRYPMYFNSIPDNLLLFRPGLIKKEDTTGVITLELVSWEEEIPDHSWVFLSERDKVTLQELRKLICPLLSIREEKAITISLFDKQIGSSGLKGKRLALARLLSLIHLKHYLKATGADIVTGISGLLYFDRLSDYFPIFDIQLLTQVLKRIGLTKKNQVTPYYLEFLVQERGSNTHRSFVETLRYFLNGALYVASKQQPLFDPHEQRHLVEKSLARLLNTGYIEQLGIDIGPYFFANAHSQLTLLSLKAKKIPEFAEFSELWDAEVKMKCKKVLLLTANNIETETVNRVAKEQYGVEMSQTYTEDHTVYILGTIAGTEIYMAQSEMGTEAPGAMTLTASDVVTFLKPDSVILVGIAFGLQQEKQHLGDVLVSKQICLYDPKKVVEVCGSEVWRARGDRSQASTKLLDRFRSGKLDWNDCEVHFGLILSGNTLVNAPEFIKKLKEMEPEAIGGEMEGGGVYCVGVKRKADWILVKGIADWGMDKSDKSQRQAALNAVRFTFHVISKGGLSV